MPTTVVKLNVGGVKYTTSLFTLRLVEPESMLARMVDQDTEAQMIQNGEEIFIDRDGDLFKYILDYLRNPTPDSPWWSEDRTLVKRLKMEADFFGVPSLLKKIQKMDEANRECPFSPGDYVQFKPEVMDMIEKYCYGHPDAKSYRENSCLYCTIDVLGFERLGCIVKIRSSKFINGVDLRKITYPLDLKYFTGRVVENLDGKPGCLVQFQLGMRGDWVDHKWEIRNSLLCRA